METLKKVICQLWVEYERGWGNRPDGYSLHLSEEDRNKFVKCFNKTFNNEESVPDEYSKAEGKPYVVMVDEVVYQELVAISEIDHEIEFRKFGEFYPGKAPNRSSLDDLL